MQLLRWVWLTGVLFTPLFAEEWRDAPVVVVERDEILRLPPELENQISEFMRHESSHAERYYYLLSQVTGIHWRYSETGTSIARDTYWNNEGNCLSWSLLTYAIAQRLGFRASLQEVEIPPIWDRYLNTTYLGRHVNVVVYGAVNADYQTGPVVIDFYPQQVKSRYISRKISIERALAMFYSNVGAEQLIKNNDAAAAANLKKAIVTDPELDGAWFNWGAYLYRTQQFATAKMAFEKAHALNERNIATVKKLIAIAEHMHLPDENQRLQKKLKKLLDTDPFYLHQKGRQYAEQQQLNEAIKIWEKADKISNFPEIKRDLINVYMTIGEHDKALHHIDELIAMEIASEERLFLTKKSAALRTEP